MLNILNESLVTRIPVHEAKLMLKHTDKCNFGNLCISKGSPEEQNQQCVCVCCILAIMEADKPQELQSAS